MNDNSVDWVYLNIESDETAFKEFSELKESSVPVLIIGDKRLNGFKLEEWSEIIL